MNIEPKGASYLSRLALGPLARALAAIDRMPVDARTHGEWLAARHAIRDAIGTHEDLIRLARWIESSEPRKKSPENA